jgi:hypothetical protein
MAGLAVDITHDHVTQSVKIFRNGVQDVVVPVVVAGQAGTVTHIYPQGLPPGTVITSKATNAAGDSPESDPSTWLGEVPAKPGLATFRLV